MSETEEDRQRLLRYRELDAQMYAQRGDNSKMVALLRELYRPDESPDLSFIADLLEKKPSKSLGRPPDEKILAGVKQHRAARVVHDLIVNKGLTVELAVVQASKELHMSESSIKKHYFACLKAGINLDSKK